MLVGLSNFWGIVRDSEETEVPTQISMHSVRNLLGSSQQLSLFNDEKVKEFAETYGVNLEKEITRYGIDLTDTQTKMMEAILNGFTRTRYKGNLDPVDKPIHAKERYPIGGVPFSYKNFANLPRLRVTQSEILRLANINQESAGDVQDAIKALKHLGITQYCFYYTRLAFDEDGTPKHDKSGSFEKEEVMSVDTLFAIKEVRSKKTGLLDYYEIIPSSIFLDQADKYFMLIPNNWREEVRKIVGQRKASSYTFRFLLFLRYQFELLRRGKDKSKSRFVFKCTPQEMAIKLKMPESVYKRKRERANKILDEVYSVAKQLQYLTNYERTGSYDILYLKEEKYSLPRHEEKLVISAKEEDLSSEMKQAKELHSLILQERRKLTPTYNPVRGGQIVDQSLKHLVDLLKEHSFDEIAQVIVWGIPKSYWCNRIGTAANLRKNFIEALTELRASTGKAKDKKASEDENRKFAEEILQKVEKQANAKKIRFEILNKYIEILDGSPQSFILNYSDKGFEEQLENALRKRGLSF